MLALRLAQTTHCCDWLARLPLMVCPSCHKKRNLVHLKRSPRITEAGAGMCGASAAGATRDAFGSNHPGHAMVAISVLPLH
jgi:hypothetical protein